MHRTTLTVLKTHGQQAHVYFPCQRRDRLMRDRLRCCCFLQQCFLAWLPLSAEPGSTIKISYDIRIGSRTALHQTGQTYPPSEVVVLALFPFVASTLLLQTLTHSLSTCATYTDDLEEKRTVLSPCCPRWAHRKRALYCLRLAMRTYAISGPIDDNRIAPTPFSN